MKKLFELTATNIPTAATNVPIIATTGMITLKEKPVYDTGKVHYSVPTTIPDSLKV